MKYFLIAGEASGDLHGANLIKAIRDKDPDSTFQFWGGDLMSAQADGLMVHYRDVTIMGFIEVVLNLRHIFKNLEQCKQQIAAFKPDVVVLIDYPGFNLRIAEYCKQQGLKTVYYIAPKIWAWKENRGKKLEKFVDRLLLIFPFEVAYFKKWNVDSVYVGNPLIDAIQAHQTDHSFAKQITQSGKPVITLMPGSRKQEISKILPIMLKVITRFPEYQFIIAGAPGIKPAFYTPWLNKQVNVVFGKTYDLLQHSTAALVCSGTATLETALFGVPQVCGYVANPVSYRIARMLVKNIRYISLVNLCLDKTAITELIQHDFNETAIEQELRAILPGGARYHALKTDYALLKTTLGNEGASQKAASAISDLISGK